MNTERRVMSTKRHVMNIKKLKRLGFDESKNIRFTKQYRVRCSGCSPLVINGVPTHEKGCPNFKHECRGCGALIEGTGHRMTSGVYCDDCV